MTEEQTKKIVQRSIIKTSDGFVDKLMSKVEADEKTVVSSFWNLKTVLSCIIALSMAISFTTFNVLDQLDFTLKTEFFISKTVILLITLLIILIIINHILRLTEEYKKLKNEV